MLYNNWISTLSANYAASLESIAAEYNFDFGTEFEIVLAHFLRRVLPARCGVCRGFVVPARGEPVGDDLIIYDKSRFPTLRGLDGDLGRKEQIPAEAVLAYIEAKHTLNKATLQKAIKQLAAIKRTPRTQVSRREILPGLLVGESSQLTKPGPGWPEIRNPWYTAIIARKLDAELSSIEAFREVLSSSVTTDLNEVPELISAAGMLMIPCFLQPNGQELRPFVTEGVASAFCDVAEKSFSLAICHLLWALERILPAEVPWQDVFVEETRQVQPTMLRWFTRPAPGPKEVA